MNFWPTHQSQECGTNSGRLELWSKITYFNMKKKFRKQEGKTGANKYSDVCLCWGSLPWSFFLFHPESFIAVHLHSACLYLISSVLCNSGHLPFHTLMRKCLSQMEKPQRKSKAQTNVMLADAPYMEKKPVKPTVVEKVETVLQTPPPSFFLTWGSKRNWINICGEKLQLVAVKGGRNEVSCYCNYLKKIF